MNNLNLLRGFFYKIFTNVAKIFSGRNLLWHLLAILLTYTFVASDFDWYYFAHTRFRLLEYIIFPAIILGSLIPLFGIIIFFIISAARKKLRAASTALALGQAALLGLLVSDLYKAFTGRIPPPEIFGRTSSSLMNISHGFQFGFLRGGVFWGWPSSHTTIAFAMALALIMLYPKNKTVFILALLYAFYVGISVSLSIHWFSEFVAGAIIGSVIGIVVGKSFQDKMKRLIS